ncbi:MAG: hypothetical protein IKL65_06305 [Bacilli bacterium]|nr:hypothetical protein [Bacilli bacterium]
MGNKIEKSLIKDIVSSLQQLDNYDFCFFLKKKYNIRDFDYSNINKILETKEGINNLKDFFEEMKDNDQLNYLTEIMLFDSSTYEGISDRLIPGLEELYKDKIKDRVR